ncbi:hypothetical protein T484DRAFT_3264174 [Baffinella frigidus]|nr:hypothetical protein T484DRAFT_3264174 [Cryptophyta sp. CCMP2293]
MSEVPRYGYRIKVCSSSTRGGSRGKRGLEEGRDILKLLRAEVVLHSCTHESGQALLASRVTRCRRWLQSAGCRVQGAGCRVQGAGCRVQGRE